FAANKTELQWMPPLHPHPAGERVEDVADFAAASFGLDGASHAGLVMFVGVIWRPPVCLVLHPRLLWHSWLSSAYLLQTGVLHIVVVHIGVHRHPLRMQGLVILRARKRREAQELHDIDGQFFFNDLDVPGDCFWRVGREA